MKYLTFVALFASCAPAHAQENCADTEAVYQFLEDNYAEERIVSGLSSGGHVVEYWGNEQTGTWTILITPPQGFSCIVDSGEGFHIHDLKAQL